LGSLAEAHDIYNQLDPQVAEKQRILEERIARDRAELEAIKDLARQSRETSTNLSSQRGSYLRSLLENPDSHFHSVFRAVLLNAEQGGTFNNRQSFEAARRLGEGLVGLAHYSESSSEPLPLVIVKNIPTKDNPTTNLQLDYGYTFPGASVELFKEGDPISWRGLSHETGMQPWISMPTLDNPPMHAVLQSGKNSHFVDENERVVKVDGSGYMLEDTLSLDDVVPTVEQVRLPLPIGNLYTYPEQRSFIIHDNPDGGIDKIALPGNYQGIGRDKLLLVGSRAINHIFGILPAHIEKFLGEEKGRVSKAMTDTVAYEELGLNLEV
jgi:hypothetical protein